LAFEKTCLSFFAVHHVRPVISKVGEIDGVFTISRKGKRDSPFNLPTTNKVLPFFAADVY